MYPFAHAGITFAAALLLGKALSKGYSQRSLPQCTAATGTSSSLQPECSTKSADSGLPRFNSLTKQIDYRLVLVGSLLPDIIDKPLTLLLFGTILNGGRLFCHSLLFLVILSLAAVYFYNRRGTTWLLALSFGTFFHLILDQMWLMPQTLLWPIYGWALVKEAPFGFETTDPSHWWPDTFHALFYNLRIYPAAYITEIIGVCILLGFAVLLVRRKRLYAFLKTGAAQVF